MKTLRCPLIIVGQLDHQERIRVLEFLLRLGFPIYAEALSGLRGEKKLQHLVTVDRPARLSFNSVLRIGGIPTCRVWRDLDDRLSHLPVLNLTSHPGLPGLSRACENGVGLERLSEITIDADADWIASFQNEAMRLQQRLVQVLQQFPESEVAVFAKLAQKLRGLDVYVGNSLPIRQWDLVSAGVELHDIYANRGANGIDGQLSTFFGWTSKAGPEAWAIVGDLTAMYDLASPWILKQLEERARRIVVINNGGGMIFKKLFRQESLLNRHEFGFSHWAQQWNLDYQTSLDAKLDALTSVLEIRPNEQQSDFFREAWEASS